MGRCRGGAADRDGGDRSRPVREGTRLSPALAWRLCALAGLVATGISLSFGQVPGLAACASPAGLGPILALELARSAGEVKALVTSGECLSGQRFALWLDVLAFIPAYTLFLLLGAWALGLQALRQTYARIAFGAIVAILLAAAADLVEDYLLFRTLDGAADLFGPLFWMVRAKFFLIGVSELLVGLLLTRYRGLVSIAGFAMGVGALWSIAALFVARNPDPIKGSALALLTLLLVVLVAAVRPALVARPKRG